MAYKGEAANAEVFGQRRDFNDFVRVPIAFSFSVFLLTENLKPRSLKKLNFKIKVRKKDNPRKIERRKT